jgi:hypothetical protein
VKKEYKEREERKDSKSENSIRRNKRVEENENKMKYVGVTVAVCSNESFSRVTDA